MALVMQTLPNTEFAQHVQPHAIRAMCWCLIKCATTFVVWRHCQHVVSIFEFIIRCNICIGKHAIFEFWEYFFSNTRRKWPITLTSMVSMAMFHVSTLLLGIHEVHGV